MSIAGTASTTVKNKRVVTFMECLYIPILGTWASQVALVVKNPLPMQEMKEMLVQSLDQEDPLEEGMATHSSILAWTHKPGRPWSIGLQRVRNDRRDFHIQ